MSTTFETNPDEICRLITAGIANDLEKLIRDKMIEQVEPLINELARDLAKGTAATIRGYYRHVGPDQMPTIQLQVVVNSKPIECKDC